MKAVNDQLANEEKGTPASKDFYQGIFQMFPLSYKDLCMTSNLILFEMLRKIYTYQVVEPECGHWEVDILAHVRVQPWSFQSRVVAPRLALSSGPGGDCRALASCAASGAPSPGSR